AAAARGPLPTSQGRRRPAPSRAERCRTEREAGGWPGHAPQAEHGSETRTIALLLPTLQVSAAGEAWQSGGAGGGGRGGRAPEGRCPNPAGRGENEATAAGLRPPGQQDRNGQ